MNVIDQCLDPGSHMWLRIVGAAPFRAVYCSIVGAPDWHITRTMRLDFPTPVNDFPNSLVWEHPFISIGETGEIGRAHTRLVIRTISFASETVANGAVQGVLLLSKVAFGLLR